MIPGEERIVYNPTEDRKRAKGKKNPKPERADEALHKTDIQEDQPKAKPKEKAKPKPEKKEPEAFINAYGFLRINQNLAEHLGLRFAKDQEKTSVTIERIPGGFIVRLKA